MSNKTANKSVAMTPNELRELVAESNADMNNKWLESGVVKRLSYRHGHQYGYSLETINKAWMWRELTHPHNDSWENLLNICDDKGSK